ncbi:MAG: restriction endonuclease subunit S [Campylobacterota bacterium]|nr:restriction endonuclease subunit S [Campylobacterota bacterium]
MMTKYQEYKPSGVDFIGDIPKHWEVRKLKFVSKSIQTGSTPASKKGDYFTDGIINWYSPSDFNSDFILDNSIKKVIEKAIKDKEVKLYNKGSILFTGVGTVGKVGLLKESSSCNQQINIITPNSQFLSSYAIYLLYIIGLEVRKFAKATILPIFNQDETKALKIILPPLKEQEKIANFLDTKNKQIEEFIKDKLHQISLLKEQKEAIINKTVTKGLDDSVEFKDSGIEWIGDIPKCWEIKKLKYCAKVVLGKMLCNTDKGNYQLKSYLKSKNVEWMNINTESVEKMWFSEYEISLYKLNKNDLVLSEGGEVGKTSLWNNEIEECYIQNSVHKVTVNNENLPKYYLYLFFLYGRVGYFDSLVNKVSIAHLTKEKLENLECVVAPKEEQKEIIKYIETETSKIDEVINQIQKEIDLIKEYKISLISEVVTGQIKVCDE